MRLRTARNSSRTRCCASRPIDRARSGSPSSARYGVAVWTKRGRVLEQDAADPIDDLVLDAADPRSHDWARLPHRFRDGESESLRDAFLHDHIGSPLKRVHDRRVLPEVVHRQARQVHALPRGAVEACDESPGPRPGPPLLPDRRSRR